MIYYKLSYVFVFRKYLPRKIRNQILPDSYAKNPFKLFEEKEFISWKYINLTKITAYFWLIISNDGYLC